MTTSRRAPAALLGVSVAAALAACAGARGSKPADGRVPDPSAPAKAAFERYPAAEVAGVKNPHAYKGKALCQRCHAPDLTLANQPVALCEECHKFANHNHPVHVVQKEPSGTLPLLPGGKVACHSCHDPHNAKVALRKTFNELCTDCHKRH
jgi:predicted CXXCH cytochrome family protein